MAQYCTTNELTAYGIRTDALRGISSAEQLAAIQAASDEIDGYLGARYVLPLVSWSNDVRQMCARLAVYTLIVVRGFNSSRAGDEQIQEQRDIAERWLHGVSHGDIVPRVVDSSSGATSGHVSGGVKVTSYASRGYSQPDNATDRGGAFVGRRSA